EGASDLHLSEGRRPVIRVAEELIPLADKQEVSSEQIREMINALISPESKEIFKKTRQIDFSYNYAGKARFRGNAYVAQNKISIALRNIPSAIKTLEDLNLPDTLRIFSERKQGFFLVVGPTGNGKTTTLASLVEMINQNRLERIITIEDPIEYVFKPKKSMIDQREVRLDTPDFKTALNGLFRQDVDVVMIGEMRNPETMSTAVTAAETGHLVFSTLHTNNAAQTIDRIIDSFPANQQDQIRLQLAGSLAGIFSMRLVPRTSGGLIPAYELLIANSAVANLIREGRTHEINTVIETGSNEGMIDLNRSLASLVQSGDITVENAYLHSLNQKVLEKMI
ncbi:MAG: PilT/PilU family type 4a pilus ATPase, partial [Candidatus Pacebacteria bacterium]|nr:PilT/PilU family type 4a pilus ATPase [Candidatus Paceibacterota bacterium]